MEGRQPASSSRAARAGTAPRSKRWLWLGAGTSLVIIAGLLAWGLSGGDGAAGGHDDWPLGAQTPAAAATTPAADEAAATRPQGGALIVDAATEQPAAALPAPPQDVPDAGAHAAAATPANPAAVTAPGHPAGATAAGTAGTAAKRGATGTARPAGSKAQGDENLLGTLLGIIKEDDNGKSKAKPKAQPQTMDDLIAQIQSDQRKRDEDDRAAFERVASKKPASTESSIQAQLRACPGPNTLKGVDCRRKICAKVTGKDAACPVM